MKKRQFVALGLAMILAMATVAGCSSSDSSDEEEAVEEEEVEEEEVEEETEAPEEDEEEEAEEAEETTGDFEYTGTGPITDDPDATLSVLAETSNYTNVDIEHAEIVETVVANSGVNIEWNLVDYNSYADSVTPRLTSGGATEDVILIPDQDDNQTYIKAGLFVPVDEYFDQMPNYTKWLDENPELKAMLTAEDGHIYYVPGTNVGHDYQPVNMFNQKWLNDAGLDAPETLDELVEVLRYFRDNDMNGNGDPDDEIPMSMMADFLPYAFGPAFGLDLVSGFMADEDGNVTYAAADSENYLAYLEFLNSLYEEGLLEVEYTSLDRDQVIERFANDLTGYTMDFSWQMSMTYSPVLPYYDGTADTGVVGTAPFSSDDYEGYYVGRVDLGNMFAVNANSENIELACRWLDYTMSEENQVYYQWGIEGESYTVADDGTFVYTEQASDNDWLQQLGINPSFVFPAQQSVESTDALVADWHAEINAWQFDYVADPWPFIYANDEEAEIISMYYVDIQTYVDENATAFITGNRSLDEFDSYLDGFEALNLDEVLQVRSDQYARYLAALE